MQEKSILECDLATAQEEIATLTGELKSASSEHCIMQARVSELEDALAHEKTKLDQNLEREALHETKIQSLQQEVDEAMRLIRDVSPGRIADGVRGLMTLSKSNAEHASRRESELAVLQAEMAMASAEIERLQKSRERDSQVLSELQSDNEALDAKIEVLNQRLAKEHEELIQCKRANDGLTADLKEFRSKADDIKALHHALQRENSFLVGKLEAMSHSFTSTQLELKNVLAANRTLEVEVKDVKDHAAHTSAQLLKCEAELSQVQLTEMKTAQLLSTANRACEELRSSNAAMHAQLRNAALLSQEMLVLVSAVGGDLKSNEEHSLDQCFVIQDLSSQLSAKCRALQDLDRSLVTSEEDREKLMRASFKLEALMKEHIRALEKLDRAETSVKQLLDATALVQEEMQGLVLEVSAAMGLIERQIGRTMTALHMVNPDEGSHPCSRQDDLISALSHLEQILTLLDTLRDAKCHHEQDQAAKENERLRLELSEAIELIAFLQNDRDRSCGELISEKEGCQALSYKLQVAERRALDSEQRCSALEQKLARARSDLDRTKSTTKTALAEMLSLIRDAVGQCSYASDFFSASCTDLCLLNAVYDGMFSRVFEDIECIGEAMRDQELVNQRLDGELGEKLKYAESLERELTALRDFLYSVKNDVSHHVQAMSGMLEDAKGDVRDSVWVLEGDLSDLKNLAHRRAIEIDEAQRQIVEGQELSRERECKIADANSEREALISRLQMDRQRADEALRQTEDAMATIVILREELVRTEQDRDARAQDARRAQHELHELNHATEKQLLQLRGQLHSHKGVVQERIMALQVESEQSAMAMAALCKELGVLKADFKRQVAILNGKVHECDEQQQNVYETIQRQERELHRHEAGVEQVTLNLELLMGQILDSERHSQQQLLDEQVRACRGTSLCRCHFRCTHLLGDSEGLTCRKNLRKRIFLKPSEL